MSVLHIALGLTEPSTLWMRRQLQMIEKDVSYLFTDIPGAKKFNSAFKCIIIRRGKNVLLYRLVHYYNLFRFIIAAKNSNVEVIFMHYLTTAVRFKSVLKIIDKPVYVHCHGYDVMWDVMVSGVPAHDESYPQKVRELPDNIIFIGNSNQTIQRLVKIGIPTNRVVLKYLGVEVPNKFIFNGEEKNYLTVLYLGRLIDFKGPDLVIRAFEIACEQGFQGELIMAGDGPLRDTCELLVAHSKFKNRIKLLGAVDADTGRELRKKADIFTAHNCKGPLSNQEEAFGVTIVEAMAEGIPIVNANNGSIKELLQNGVTAILVEPGDIHAHAEGFLRLYNDKNLCEELAKKAWEHARKNFTLEVESINLHNILGLNIAKSV